MDAGWSIGAKANPRRACNETKSVLVSQVMSVTDQGLNEAILDATKKAIERRGVERLTINDVCDAAKVSRATLYLSLIHI